jgi:hypothetical protein
LRYYATSRKITGSIPDEIIGFFYEPNPSKLTMALGLTEPLIEISIRNTSESKEQPARNVNNLTVICDAIG